ncbi:hypothetical protein A3A03_00810 [Candidatus Nomurabacteria bacterium RIFCSPLOWO2_01_FULL_40_18]|uniref:Uncharacterized protein n=1 Tax=Candidatus Nomurabacteria bacterium RIFCSPLOWO2_01_FULL_40_18 TaxID=1801773 RepID=A0A1F6XHF2_9BACT|nr:MAG: hypothetical protein A3A03_00810 [Candidatus Nomurabacteria bacterium RIFCSPLOWO2_01_FULL_40_18]
MINDQLLGYVKRQLSLNVSREVITNNLKSQGWTDADLSEVFAAIAPAPATAPVTATAPSSVPLSPAQPVQTNFSEPAHHSKTKKIFSIIVVLVLLLAAGAGTYAYYTGYFVSLPTIFTESISNSKNITSAKYDISLDIDLSELQALNSAPNPSGIDFKKFNFSASGASDISNIENPKLSSILSLTMGSILASAELRVLDKTFYGQITKIPDFGNLPVPLTLSAYQNKWFSLSFKPGDIDKLKALDQSFQIDSNNFTNQLTPEQRDHLLKLFQDANLMKTTKRLNPETVDGESSYHFSFDFDRDATISFAQSVYDYLNTLSVDKNIPKLPPFNSIIVSELLDKIKNFNGEIWIGRNDKLIHKLSVSFGIQPSLAKNEQIKTKMVIVYSDYNKPVSVVAPEGSTSLNDLLLVSFSSARQKGKEAALKSVISNMGRDAELFYERSVNQSYSGLCAFFYSKNAKKDIEDKYGGTGFVCKDSPTKYAIGVKLSPNSGNWCLDSTGANKSTTTLPSSTVCPQ